MRLALGKLALILGVVLLVLWTGGAGAPATRSIVAIPALDASVMEMSTPDDGEPDGPCSPFFEGEPDEELDDDDGLVDAHVLLPLPPALCSNGAWPGRPSSTAPIASDVYLSFDTEPATPPPRG